LLIFCVFRFFSRFYLVRTSTTSRDSLSFLNIFPSFA